jgi:hypothetical protein
MFEKIGRLAETAANKVSLSRRGFLGRLGRGALAVTGVVGGLLALPREAHARGTGVPLAVCVQQCCATICGDYTCSACSDPTTYDRCWEHCAYPW